MHVPVRSRTLRALLLMSFLLMVLIVRVYVGAVSEYRRATSALEVGDVETAIIHLERCAKWYFPGNPTSKEALTTLWRLGQEAEAAKKVQEALEAYQSIRAGLYATRAVSISSPELLLRANERIAHLQATSTGSVWPDQRLSLDERKAEALSLLQRDVAPDSLWSLLSVIGFVGWVGAALAVMRWGFEESGRLRPRAAIRWGLWGVLGYAMWVIGLMRA